MTYCPDPRTLDPPDDPPCPAPRPVWHFLADDWEHEHWIDDPTEVDNYLVTYAQRGVPFTLRRLLTED